MDIPFDITRLHAAYRAGLSPRAVIADVLERIDRAGDPGIFIEVADRAALLAEADALGPFDLQARPLWGLPFAIKDNIDAVGFSTTAACPAFAYRPGADAEVVRRLRAAGAIAVGKTNLDQFATGLVGTRTPHPIPRNALDPALVPGGSSSGSAVAVARGIVAFALGTDTAGSGRVPAALNNIVGLKPSLGLVSTRGVVPACRTLDCVSIFALTVGDAWQVLGAAAGYDAADPYSRKIDLAPPGQGVRRIGVPAAAGLEFFGDGAGPGDFSAALDRLAGLGCEIEEIDYAPFAAAARLLYEGAWVAERHAAIRPLLEAKPHAIHEITRAIVAGALGKTATSAFEDMYRLAGLRRAGEAILAGIDAIAVPTLPRAVSLAEVVADPMGANSRLGLYTNFVNLMDLCALAVPSRLGPGGRAFGLSLIAPSGHDGPIADLAARFGAAASVPLGATGWPAPEAAEGLDLPDQADGLVPVFVVGAHLSGEPLNRDLVARGARARGAARTAPCYRFYDIGGRPRRPGMLRTLSGGASIDGEVWALPQAAFGGFVAAIAPPLSIGTVDLEDGRKVMGFLVEAAGVEGASDITGYGGWKAYLADPPASEAAAPGAAEPGAAEPAAADPGASTSA